MAMALTTFGWRTRQRLHRRFASKARLWQNTSVACDFCKELQADGYTTAGLVLNRP